MKKLLCLVMALLGLASAAHADGWVEVKPGKGDLTKAQVKEFAVKFFAEKCGVEESVLRKAEWTIQYGHSTVLTAEDAHWVVDTHNIKGHSDLHYIYLTGPGEMIKWGAHIGEYTTAYPELLDYATPVDPLPTDVQEDAVIALVREEMVKQGFVKDASALTVTPTFAYDQFFNVGFIPVWLVQIDGAADGSWKAAVTHKGELLSLVPYEQVFRENRTPNEDFWGTTFKGQAYSEEHSLLNGGQMGCGLQFCHFAVHIGGDALNVLLGIVAGDIVILAGDSDCGSDLFHMDIPSEIIQKSILIITHGGGAFKGGAYA